MMEEAAAGRLWIILGSLSAFVGVAMGAFGAHGLASRLDARMLAVFNTGAQYQMYHALALIGLGLWTSRFPAVSTAIPGWAFVLGTILFSGSLYALAMSGVRILGAITPFGGVSFLVGWLAFAWTAWKAAS
jgi:uncharacterized membrane protein YgdD (TMEM256/DUF423 family)